MSFLTLEQFKERYYPNPYKFDSTFAEQFFRFHGLDAYKEVDCAIELDYNDWLKENNLIWEARKRGTSSDETSK